MATLETLIDRLRRENLLREADQFDKNVTIGGLANDSRSVGPKTLFVAIRGERVDGHLFIDKAVENGAIAVVCEAVPGDLKARFPGTVFATVSNSRKAWAQLAAAYHKDPSTRLRLVGITGTNGKSTTAFLVHHVLTQLGARCGLIGTISYRIGSADVPATHTTPDALDLNHLLSRMVDSGCGACAMEVSSHALDQDRVDALDFDVAVFTNLTHDHLDYHGSFASYLDAKRKLFTSLKKEAVAVYNADDPASEAIIQDICSGTLSYGQWQQADVRFEVLSKDVDGLVLRLDGFTRKFRLVGSFNAFNITAAYCAARALDYQSGDIVEALAAAPPVPGRFEQIPTPGGGLVIVDYAHTPDALENVLRATRDLIGTRSRLICVFGCGGDRDPAKRRSMGSIAESHADHVIVTSDNPRTEDPEKILADIRGGFRRASQAQWIVDRRSAIEAAARLAQPGDVVLIAGKGHETYQVIGNQKLPFDDRQVAREVFEIPDALPS